MSKTVMFIIHERTVLSALERLLENQPYFRVFMKSTDEAKAYLKKHQVNMIVINNYMPGMNSEEFLLCVKDNYPNIIRVILCDIGDTKSVSKLVEKGVVKQLLFKPWDNKEMIGHIESLLTLEYSLMNAETLQKLSYLDELPALPTLYKELTTLIAKNADIDEVANVISRDQAIALKVLGLANSAFYGRRTGNINQAIMGIGLNNVKNIVLANSVFKSSNKHLDTLWNHGVNTNRLLIAIYKECLKTKMPTLYGSIGLLHDIGRVIMYHLEEDMYETLLKDAQQSDYIYVDLEEEKLNATHQELGAYLLSMWELPYVYVESAMFHHHPLDNRVVNKELVAVVHIANYYSLKMMNPDGTNNLLNQEVFDYLKIKRDDVEIVVKQLMEAK